MIDLTQHTVIGLVGLMYVQLSMCTDKGSHYINGWIDTIYHYESALKTTLYFNPTSKEVPIKRNLLSLKFKEYDKTLFGNKKEYSDGAIDANNALYYHVQEVYLNKGSKL